MRCWCPTALHGTEASGCPMAVRSCRQLSSTLIFGEHDAVLVDPPFTRDQVQRVGDWVAHSGRRLAYIYATHGHGDHWFGTHLLMQRFPGAVAYATEGTIRLMRTQATEGRKQLWDVDFPGLIPDSPVVYQAVPRDGLSWRAIACRRSRPDIPIPTTPPCCTYPRSVWSWPAMSPTTGCTSTCSRVAGVESRRGGRRSTKSLRCGHARWWPATKTRTLPDDPAILDETRAYLLDAQRLLADKPSPLEFYEQMLAGYPDRLNLGPLWYGALGLLG